MDKQDRAIPEPTILFLEDEEGYRVEIIRFLEGLGYRVLMTTSEEETLSLLREHKPKVDLILVNQLRTSDQALETGRRLREFCASNNQTPIVVIPSEYVDQKEGSDQSVGENEYKTYMTTSDQLRDLLKKILPAKDGHN